MCIPLIFGDLLLGEQTIVGTWGITQDTPLSVPACRHLSTQSPPFRMLSGSGQTLLRWNAKARSSGGRPDRQLALLLSLVHHCLSHIVSGCHYFLLLALFPASMLLTRFYAYSAQAWVAHSPFGMFRRKNWTSLRGKFNWVKRGPDAKARTRVASQTYYARHNRLLCTVLARWASWCPLASLSCHTRIAVLTMGSHTCMWQ